MDYVSTVFYEVSTFYKNKTNHLISSNNHPMPTANIAIHCLVLACYSSKVMTNVDVSAILYLFFYLISFLCYHQTNLPCKERRRLVEFLLP